MMASVTMLDKAKNAIMDAAIAGVNFELLNLSETLERTDKNKVVSSYDNLCKAISCFDIGYDTFLECPMILRDGAWERFEDEDYVDIAIQLERVGFQSMSMNKIKDVVRKVMNDKRFDSAQDWGQMATAVFTIPYKAF